VNDRKAVWNHFPMESFIKQKKQMVSDATRFSILRIPVKKKNIDVYSYLNNQDIVIKNFVQ
jgi:cytochrome c2